MTDLNMTTHEGSRGVWANLNGKSVILGIEAVNEDNAVSTYLTSAQAHEIADWIKANVPEPEKTPLPAKYAAVVKTTDGELYTRAGANLPDDYVWLRSGRGGVNWVTDAYLIGQGFEVIFEGVDL